MGIVDISNPMGNMKFTILTTFVEYERNCINERIREVNQIKMLNNPDSTMCKPKKYKKYLSQGISLF
jgi:DNA invertase Pin-like site-specific DNA recombinase